MMTLGSRRSAGIIAASAVVLIVAALGVLSRPIETRSDPIPSHADAVIALSSGVRPDSQLDAAGTERLRVALALVEAGVAPILLTTRVQRGRHGPTSDAPQRRLVSAAGLTGAWRVTPAIAHSTRDEAQSVRAMLRPGARLVVVTTPYHTRRACSVFEAVGFRVSCIATRMVSDASSSWRARVHERLARVKYRALGWIK